MTASCVGPTNVPPRSTGDARDRRGRRPAADPVTALQHDDVVAEPDQVARRGQAREAGPDDDDVDCLLLARALVVGVGVTRLGSHAVKVMTALFGPIDAIEQARALRDAGASGVFTFEGTTRRLHAADPGVDRRRPGPDDQRRNRVSAQPDSSRSPGDRPPAAQRGPIRAGTGHADPHADREAVRRRLRQAGGADDRAGRRRCGRYSMPGRPASGSTSAASTTATR